MKENTKQHTLLWKTTQIRWFEEIICEVYGAQEMKLPVHLCIGEEAILTGFCAHLNDKDYATSTHRNHGVCLSKGVPPMKMFADLWHGSQRHQSLEWCKNHLDATHCRVNCRMDPINTYLWELTQPGPHRNFI